MSEEEIIAGCRNNDRHCQKILYEMFASKMFAVCTRYASSKMEAQDILQDGFVKVFMNLGKYKDTGNSIGAWIRTVIVHTAIEFYRKRKHDLTLMSEELNVNSGFNENTIETMDAKIILNIVQQLPEGYRQIFNLYAVEGYTHHEIGAMLGISDGTSKSQYSHAKKKLQEIILHNKISTTTNENARR